VQRAVFGVARSTGLARLAAGRLGARLLPVGLVAGARLLLAGQRGAQLAGPTTGPAVPAGTAPAAPAVRAGDDSGRHPRAGLFTGCIGRWLLPGVEGATRRLLRRAGWDVVEPRTQRCCGALHAHAGDLSGARALARANIAAFEQAGTLDAVVVNAAGCGAHLKQVGRLFENDPAWSERAQRFARRVRDALEILGEAPSPSPSSAGRVEARVAYHDACHLAHGQGIRQPPRDLLASIPGLRLVPLEDCDRCCGSAGVYNLVHARVADMLLERKLVRLQQSGATHVAAANAGCLLHLAAGVQARDLPLTVVHPLELLNEAARG
jgi:glycolate oxidase iron-sulfur subunit